MIGEYLGFLIVCSSVVGFGGLVFGAGREGATVRLSLGVMLLSVAVIPIVSLIAETITLGEIIFSENMRTEIEGESLYEKTAEEAFCEGVEKLVANEFSVAKEDVEVCVTGFSVERMCADSVKVILSGSAVYVDNRSVAARINGLGLGRCEVVLEID